VQIHGADGGECEETGRKDFEGDYYVQVGVDGCELFVGVVAFGVVDFEDGEAELDGALFYDGGFGGSSTAAAFVGSAYNGLYCVAGCVNGVERGDREVGGAHEYDGKGLGRGPGRVQGSSGRRLDWDT